MIENELIFEDDIGSLLVVMPPVLNKLWEYRQLGLFSTEAAGVLIGERRGSHIVVHEISEPGNGDVRHRYHVDRRGHHHQAAVNNAFKRSSGQWQYLGEWHTHPEDVPAPSLKDLSTWRRHLVAKEQMALLIVGRKKIWAAKKNGDHIVELHKI